MDRRWGLAFMAAAALLAATAQGTEIYKCEDDAGHIFYRDHPCGDPAARREIDDSTYTVSGRGGLTDREWDEYNRILEQRAERTRARIESGRAQVDTAIGYEDRQRLRVLRMRRKHVLRSIKNATIGEAVMLRQELEEIGRQEETILTRRER